MRALIILLAAGLISAISAAPSMPEQSAAAGGRDVTGKMADDQKALPALNTYLIKGHMTEEEAKEVCASKGLKYVRKVASFYMCKGKKGANGGKGGAMKMDRDVLKELKGDKRVTMVEEDRYVKPLLYNFTDPYWPSTWHLSASQTPSMRVHDAWAQGYTGGGVVVGFVDSGIDPDHTDIVDNYRADLGYDYISDDTDPSHASYDSGHGTSCAGIVAASPNGFCTVGVAYNSTFTAIRNLDNIQPTTLSGTASALTHRLDVIDIYSNSWGFNTNGQYYVAIDNLMKAAFAEGGATGRGGKGAIYTFAAGNSDQVNGDCNAQEHKQSIYTIVIGSVSPDGSPAYYSEPGAVILASTYGGDLYDSRTGIVTISKDNTCILNFQGTSAATPVASGIIALALQANPNLTYRDVQHLIVETSTTSGLTGDPFITNGAGHQVSNYFGFGLMNAAAMVTRAQTWNTVPALRECDSGTFNARGRTTYYDVSDTQSFSGCGITKIEHVIARVSIDTVYRGNLQINLVSPSGTRSRLIRWRPNDYLYGWYYWDYGTVQFWGENPSGNWKVELDDRWFTMKRLMSWSIKVYGT